MPAIPHLQARLDSYIQRQMEADTEYGYLGILVSGGYVFAVDKKPGYVHCRIENGLGLEPAECLVKVALDPYTRVKFKREGGVLVAKEFVASAAAANYGVDGALLDVPGLPMPDRGSLDSDSDGLITLQDGTYQVARINASATSDPTLSDDSGDGYQAGWSWWLNTATGVIFDLTDETPGAAVWVDRQSASALDANIDARMLALLLEGRKLTRMTGMGAAGGRPKQPVVLALLKWPFGARR